MPLPDVVIKVSSALIPRSAPTNTGTAFIAGVTERGPSAGPRKIHSIAEYVQVFGARLATGGPYDWTETFFGEQGSDLYVSRVFGAGAKPAELILKDSGAGESLVAKAGSRGETDPGLWGNGAEAGLGIAVEKVGAGEEYNLKIYVNKVLVEESPTLATQADGVAWAKLNSNYIVLVLGSGTKSPTTLAEKALSGGTAGAAVADADWLAALERIPSSLGPGQVSVPGQTTAVRQGYALAHAVANNRFALLDGTDTATAATLIAQAQALYTAANKGRRYGQILAPWDVIPGLTVASTRTVPPSARAAAQYARVDRLGNPNLAAAGRRGEAQFVIDLSQAAYSNSDRKLLNEAGVTVSLRRFGGSIMTWGLRTLADQLNDELWSQAPGVRTIMAFFAKAQAVGDPFIFNQIDGFGHTAGELQGALTDIAHDLWERGALFGEVPAEAFSVNVGPGVNTPTTISEGQIRADVGLRISPNSEQVIISIVRVPITQELGG